MKVTLPIVCVLFCGVIVPAFGQSREELTEEVRETEIAFAKSMADRNHDAFVSFVAKDAIFLGNETLKGSDAIGKAWKRFFEKPQAPFAWEPAVVELDDSGKLALSTGPVKDSSGKQVGTFTSVWRRDADGQWKIALDYGCSACDCGAK